MPVIVALSGVGLGEPEPPYWIQFVPRVVHKFGMVLASGLVNERLLPCGLQRLEVGNCAPRPLAPSHFGVVTNFRRPKACEPDEQAGVLK